jgi:polyhydroxyalkanoate synthase
VPWENAARSVDLLGGTSRFVLSSSGHIQALVNPPDNGKSSYTVDGAQRQGSWWPDYAQWLADRSGELVRAPKVKAGAKAPGTYVHAN